MLVGIVRNRSAGRKFYFRSWTRCMDYEKVLLLPQLQQLHLSHQEIWIC